MAHIPYLYNDNSGSSQHLRCADEPERKPRDEIDQIRRRDHKGEPAVRWTREDAHAVLESKDDH